MRRNRIVNELDIVLNGVVISPLDMVPDVTYEQLDKSQYYTSHSFYSEISNRLQTPRGKSFIDFYNNARFGQYGPEGHLPAEFTSRYNLICPDPSRRIVSVGINNGYVDDIVLVPLKKILMFRNVYTRCEGFPISVKGIQENATKVTKLLLQEHLIEKISVCSGEVPLVEQLGMERDNEIESWNFYSNKNTIVDKVTSNRWKTKKGINRIFNFDHFQFTSLKHRDSSIDYIISGFDKYKEQTDKNVGGWKRLCKAISEYPFWRDDHVSYIMGWYRHIPLYLCVYIECPETNSAHQIVNQSMAHNVYLEQFRNELDLEEVSIFDEIIKRTGALIHYHMIIEVSKNPKIDHLYFGGALSSKKLRIYKQILNEKEFSCIIYK